jgi:hypothetical protein
VGAHAEGRGILVGVDAAEHAHPQLDVLPLQPAHLVPVAFGERVEVAILHADRVRVLDREPHVRRDEGPQRVGGVRMLAHRRLTAGVQARAHLEQHGAEHRLLAVEVPVDRRAAHTGSGAELLHRDALEPAFGEEPRRRLEQGRPAVGLGSAAGSGDVAHASQCRHFG